MASPLFTTLESPVTTVQQNPKTFGGIAIVLGLAVVGVVAYLLTRPPKCSLTTACPAREGKTASCVQDLDGKLDVDATNPDGVCLYTDAASQASARLTRARARLARQRSLAAHSKGVARKAAVTRAPSAIRPSFAHNSMEHDADRKKSYQLAEKNAKAHPYHSVKWNMPVQQYPNPPSIKPAAVERMYTTVSDDVTFSKV